MTTKKTLPYEYGKFTQRQINMIDSGAVINRPGRLGIQHTILQFYSFIDKKSGKKYLAVESYDTIYNRPKSEIKTPNALKKYLLSNTNKHPEFRGYVKNPEDMQKLMYGDMWVGYFTFDGDPLTKSDDTKKTASHVLGHNRTVIVKKPRKYTSAYNYRENQWRQLPTPNHSLIKDSKRAAKEPGWRPVFNKQGNVDHYYFERRENRSDTQKQRRTALGLKSKVTSYGRRNTGVIIDRQKPKTILIIPEIPAPQGRGESGKYYYPNPKKPLTPAQVNGIIRKAELAIHEKPKENCYIIDVTKGVVFTNTGGKKSVKTGTLCGQQYILTHNHPNEYSLPNILSGADIAVMLNRNLGEIRACCYGYVYRMKPGNANRNHWKEIKQYWDRNIKEIYKVIDKNYKPFTYIDGESIDARNQRIKQYNAEYKKTIFDAWDNHADKLAKDIGLWYKKERI